MKVRTFVVTLALGVLACGQDDPGFCTDAACPDAVTMVVAGTDGAGLTEGEYAVTLTLDGDSWSTSCSTAAPAGCRPLEGPTSLLSIDATSDRRIVLSLPADAGQRPETYTLRLERGEETLLETSNALEYQVENPNGPDCEPACESAPPLEFEAPQ